MDWHDLTDEKLSIVKGDDLINLYNYLFSCRCYNHPSFSVLSLFVILGQLFRQARIEFNGNFLDPRVHLMLFSPSGTGKGRGMDFVIRIARRVGLTVQPILEFTDAFLLGGFEPETYTENGKKKTRWNVIYGALTEESNIDILTMEEASILFDSKATEYTKNAMIYFQTGLNTIGSESNRLTKGLLHGKIDSRCVSSLLFTTFPPANLFEHLVKKGFLPRMINIVEDVPSEQRRKNAHMMIDNLGLKNTDYTLKEHVLVNSLKKLAKKNIRRQRLSITKDSIQALHFMIDDIFKSLEGMNYYSRRKMEEFTNRFQEHIIKISLLHSIIDNRNVIEMKDIAFANKVVLPVWNRLTSFVEEQMPIPIKYLVKERRVKKTVLQAYKNLAKREKNGWVPKPLLIDELSKVWQLRKISISRRIDSLVDEKIFEKQYKGFTPYVRQIADPKQF